MKRVEASFGRGASEAPTRLRVDGDEYPVDWIREIRPALEDEGASGHLLVRLRGYSRSLDRTMNISLVLPGSSDDSRKPDWAAIEGGRARVANTSTSDAAPSPMTAPSRPAETALRASERASPPAGLDGWRRASCLGCGGRVVRNRDAYCTVGGTLSGSWAIAWPTRAGHMTATGPTPVNDLAYLLGVCHRTCLASAMDRVLSGQLGDGDPFPVLTLKLADGEYELHLPAGEDVCLFCDSRGPMTDEHVWPRWLSRELAARGLSLAPAPGSRRPRREIDLKAPVCRECNNGWMSVLESDVRKVALPMLWGDFVHLSAGDHDLLSVWALKTAFMIDRLSGAIVPRGHAMELALERRPLSNSMVFLGAYDGDWAASGEAQPFGILNQGGPAGVVVTFTLYKLAFQVILHFTRGGMQIVDSRAPGVTRQLWPRPAEATVTWPPPTLLVNDDIQWLASSISVG